MRSKNWKYKPQKDAEMLKKDLSEKAKQDIEKIKAATKQAIQNEVQSAKFELKQEVVKMAVELAEQQIKLQIQQDDQSNLHNDFVKQVSNKLSCSPSFHLSSPSQYFTKYIKNKEPSHGQSIPNPTICTCYLRNRT